ncbi:MAG TPA: DUF2255 family protein [Actinomycetes bacterium]|nr:DUF2255 family protein [Actinomycetes bacterium]
MTTWTSDELARIDAADELQLASQRRDDTLRKPVTIWVVRVVDDLYVRSMHGPAGAWFRGTQTTNSGHISAGGVDKDVAFVVDTESALNDRVDAAFRTKYRRHGERFIRSVVNPAARESTIRLVPR